jgi:hypothetical protein
MWNYVGYIARGSPFSIPIHDFWSGLLSCLVPCLRTILKKYVATERTSAVSFPATNNDTMEMSNQTRQLRFGELGVKDRQQGNFFATLRVSARQEIPQYQ